MRPPRCYNFRMDDRFCRTEMQLGKQAVQKLKNARVAVFGIGGVGGYAVETLARSGVGALDLIDGDVVDVTNINRQIIAAESTVGMPKVEAAKARVLDINPQATVRTHQLFFLPERSDELDFTQYDYIVDAVDTVTAKIALAVKAAASGVPIISSMGTGNKLDPCMLEVADIYSTSVCPLARVMRSELRKRGIDKLKVVYSREKPIEHYGEDKRLPSSNAFVPAAAGLIIASEVVKDIIAAKK